MRTPTQALSIDQLHLRNVEKTALPKPIIGRRWGMCFVERCGLYPCFVLSILGQK
jgi:hypothetical protein